MSRCVYYFEILYFGTLCFFSSLLRDRASNNDLRGIEIRKATCRKLTGKKPTAPHRKLARFLPDAPTVRCVAASRRESRTRRSWTTCCCRRVTTSGFCPRSKVHWGPYPNHSQNQKATTPIRIQNWLPNDHPEHLEHHRHRYHHTAPHNHSSLLTPRYKSYILSLNQFVL